MKMVHIFFLLLANISFSIAQDTTYYSKSYQLLDSKTGSDHYAVRSFDPLNADRVIRKSFYSSNDKIRSEETYQFVDAQHKSMQLNGLKTTWYENGQVHSKQYFTDGMRTGQLETYWPTGSPKRVETYQDHQSIKSVCYSEKGKEIKCTPFREDPSFPGGLNRMYGYLAKNIVYPTSLSREGKNARVITTFLVLEDGTLDDIKILEGGESEVNLEALRVVRAMPKWKPAKEDGVVLVERFTLPINFQVH